MPEQEGTDLRAEGDNKSSFRRDIESLVDWSILNWRISRRDIESLIDSGISI